MLRTFLLILLTASSAFAEQPIFGEMPRWAGGWGVQSLHEVRTWDDDTTHWLHVEGVYTWQRWIRATLKVPTTIQPTVALGTPILALPIKQYFNLNARSGSWTLTPEWFVPVHTLDGIASRKQLGLSGSYETETYRFHGAAGLGVHRLVNGGYEASIQAATGLNIHVMKSSGHIKLKADLSWHGGGSYDLQLGPTVYWRFSDRWHGQISYKRTAFLKAHGEKASLRSGIAVVF